jgi:hypothetical protein
MNKKGNSMGLTVVLAIFLFIVMLTTLNFIKPELTTAKSVNGLDCENTGISDFNMLTCLGVDLVLSWYFLLLVSIIGGAIIAAILK